MTRNFFSVCLALASSTANAVAKGNVVEFGRIDPPRSSALKRRDVLVKADLPKSHDNGVLRRKDHGTVDFEDASIDEIELIELERNLLLDDYSMSMSYKGSKSKSKGKGKGSSKSKSKNGNSKGNSKEGAYGSQSPNSNPATAPSVTSPSSSATPYPTFTQSLPLAPSASPPSFSGTPTPTVSAAPTVSVQPTVTAIPTTSLSTDDFFGFTDYPTSDDIFQPSISPTTVFDLSEDNSVIVVEPPHDETTVVRMEILYLVEAFVNGTEEFEADLDWRIFAKAVVASLGANSSGVLEPYTVYTPTRRSLMERELLSSSSYLRSCNATLVEAKCYIMEADIVYILNGEKNADLAAYRAYLALHDDMSSFDEDLPNVIRVEYLAPLPVLPPNPVDDEENSEDAFLSSRKTNLSFNAWTVGAAVAMSTGGLMALIVWNRNRRTRNRRHIQLLEDISVNPPEMSPPESAQREIVSHPL